jgi:hypothetical protein
VVIFFITACALIIPLCATRHEYNMKYLNYSKNYNLCRISGIERFTDMLSLNRALNPFTLYNSSYFCRLSDDNVAPTPCSPIPKFN